MSFSASRFTLYDILKGNKADFRVVMSPAKAKLFYASLAEKFQRSYLADSVKGDKYVFYKLLHFTQFANPNS
jgi:D-Tyr-tRNAtyr deacylase